MRRRPDSTRSAPRPLRRHPPVRLEPAAPTRISTREKLWWGLGLLLLVGGLVYLLRSVFAILFTSVVLAYLLDPLVDRFEARGYQRETGIGIIFAAAAGGLSLVLLVLVPSVANEVAELSGNLGTYVAELRVLVLDLHQQAEQRLGTDIPISYHDMLDQMQQTLTAGEGGGEGVGGIGQALQDAAPNLGRWLAALLTSTLSGSWSVIVTLLNLALLPIFTFYLLVDWDRLVAAVDELVPHPSRPLVRRMATAIDQRIGSFVRGQTTICLILGVLYSIGLLISGIDLAIVVGMTAGILFIVPYLGTVVGVVLATALALLKFGLDWHLLAVWGTFAAVQGLEGFVLTPRIMGDKVGLHPLVVMLALLVGGNLYGVWGMLLAIPATAAGQVMISEWMSSYRTSRFFGGGGA